MHVFGLLVKIILWFHQFLDKASCGVQGLHIPEDIVIQAIQLAEREAREILNEIAALARIQPGSRTFGTSGSDPAAQQRVFEMGADIVDNLLQNTALESWQLYQQLAAAKTDLFARLGQMGLFRFEVSS